MQWRARGSGGNCLRAPEGGAPKEGGQNLLVPVKGTTSGEARSFKVGRGVKGRVREGFFPAAEGPGAVSPKKFSNYRCMQVSFSAFFRQKSTH
jgi:hypothetical protein